MGPQGLPGAPGMNGLDGSEGPIGPQGPRGPAGGSVRAERTWAASFEFSSQNQWVEIPGGTLEFTSEGGPLLINVDLTLLAAGTHYSCRPVIDGQWAGAFGGLASGLTSDLWLEGIDWTSNAWSAWSKSRVYPGVPAGPHVLSVECLKNELPAMRVGHEILPQSVSVIEMH